MSFGRHLDQTISNEFEVGIDAESTARFESGLDDVAKSALFAQAEQEYCASFPDAARRFAGAWCAKEAAVKALSRWVQLDPRRVVVTWANDGRPSIGVFGWDADKAGVSTSVNISSHGPLAVAWVVAWGPPPVSESDTVRDGRPS